MRRLEVRGMGRWTRGCGGRLDYFRMRASCSCLRLMVNAMLGDDKFDDE